MDAFEELATEMLRAEGYWVQRGLKIELTTAEKRALDNPSMPRPELDLVAYKPGTGELLAIECKSYLDSSGVSVRDLIPGGRYAHRYKMFTDERLRTLVLAKLVDQLAAADMVVGRPVPRLGLIYGHAAPNGKAQLQQWFDDRGWLLRGPVWLNDRLHEMAGRSYDNQVASVVAKLLLNRRGSKRARAASATARVPRFVTAAAEDIAA